MYLSTIDYPGTGLLNTVTGTPSGGSSVEYAKCTKYAPTGKIGKITHTYNNTATVYTYDLKSTRLKELQTTGQGAEPIIQYKRYTYSKAGDIETINDLLKNIIYTYQYDNLHRLLSETSTDATLPTDADILTYNYDYADHINAVSSINYNGVNKIFNYDDNGNMTDGWDFTDSGIVERDITWNADNMPVTVTRGGVATNLTYDGDGVRAIKVAGGTTTYYVTNDYEIKDGAAIKYIFAGNLRVAEVEGTTTPTVHIFHKDHLGSSTAMTNNTGTKVEGTEYLPFGGMRAHTGVNTSDYLFSDQEVDISSNLYNYDARLYDPVIGRFISADAVVPEWNSPQSLNRYSYCINNPLIYTDPSGHVFWLPSWDLFGWIFGNKKEEIEQTFEPPPEPEKSFLYQVLEANYGPEDESDWGYEIVKDISERPVEFALLPFVMGEFVPTTKGVKLSGKTPKNTVFRYVGPVEAKIAKNKGVVPNINQAGKSKNVFFTTDRYANATEAENALKIGSQNPISPTTTPTHRITVDATKPNWKYGGNVEGGTGTELITTEELRVISVEPLKR